MFIPTFDELMLLFVFLAIIAIIPSQILYSGREKDIVINKKRFRLVSYIFAVIALFFLLADIYLTYFAS